MRAFEAYAAYTASIIGHPVEDAEAKFDALVRLERDAWEAVASLGTAPTKTAPKPTVALPSA